MAEDYNYPLNPDWTTEELISVVDMWSKLEEAYEKSSSRRFLTTYADFKKLLKV